MSKGLIILLERLTLFHCHERLYYIFTFGHLVTEQSATQLVLGAQLCVTLWDVLVRQFLTFCYQKGTQTVICDFEKIFGFPKVVGEIDFCHRIKKLVEAAEDHINWKDYHS